MTAVIIFLVFVSFFTLGFYVLKRVVDVRKEREFLKTAKPLREMTEGEVTSVKKLLLVSKVKGLDVFRLEGDYEGYTYDRGGPHEFQHHLIGGVEVFLACCENHINLKNNVVEVVRTNLGLLVIKANDDFYLPDSLEEKESRFFIDGKESEHPEIRLVGKRALHEVEEKERWSDENSGVLAAFFAWLSVSSFWYSGSLDVSFYLGVFVLMAGALFSCASMWLLFLTVDVKTNRQVLQLSGQLRFVEAENYIDRSFYLGGVQLWAPHGWSEELKAYDGVVVDLEVSDDEHYIFSAPGLSIKEQYGDMPPAKIWRFFFYLLIVSPLFVMIDEPELFNESVFFPENFWLANISIFLFLTVGVICLFRELDRAEKRKKKSREYMKRLK
ncbi:MAG: IgaA/UmoB family intracellular growth attenuator [Pseudomonadota bacterium]